MKTHYSIAELMAFELNDFPTTRRGWEYLVNTKKWDYKEVPSRGKGGFRKEYEVSTQVKDLIYIKLIKHEVATAPKKPNTPTTVTVKDKSLTDWQREIASHKLIVVRYLEQKIRSGERKTRVIEQFIADANNGVLPTEIMASLNKANAKAGKDRTVSRRSLFDWMKTVEESENHQLPVLSTLAPKQRAIQPLPAWAKALLKLWRQPQKPALTTCLEQLPQYFDGSLPNYHQAYRFLKVRLGNVDVMRGRMGARELRNLQPFIRRGTEATLPTDVYTADGHCFDAEIAHPIHGRPFRPEITSIIDVATRRVVGWSISLSETSWCVLDAIRMSATECGIPAIFYVDNGSGYKNALLNAEGHGVLARLNTEISHALPYNSQAKGIIERSHQTLWVKAAKNLPTYIGKDMDKEAGHLAHKTTRHEVKNFSQSKILMTWQDFIAYAEQVVEEYNHKPHRGLKQIIDSETGKKRHQTPMEAWNSALADGAEIQLVEDWDAEDLFRPYEERKVRRGEIELFGNRYFSAQLEQFHGDTVLAGYDIHDADKITVRTVEGQLICHALWNANKRDYFPKAKLEQLREKRAQGRLRRHAVKSAEILAEVSPKAVLEHINNQDVIPFDEIKRAQLDKELDALPMRSTEHQPFFKTVNMPIEEKKPVQINKVERWIRLDEAIKQGEIIEEADKNFWKLFPLSKKFEELKMADETLKDYLERRQA